MSGATAAISIAATVLAASVSAAAQYQSQRTQEKSAKAAAEYNAQVAENEAATQAQLGQNEIAKGVSDRERQQRSAARAMGDMRAEMGASGFEMDTGTQVSLLAESAEEHQYDSNIIRQNSEQAAWQHMVGVTGAQNNAAFANSQRQNANSGRTGSYLGMGGTLLGGIASGIGDYNKWQKAPQAASPYKGYKPGMAFGSNPDLYKGKH